MWKSKTIFLFLRDILDNGAIMAISEATMIHNYIHDKENLGLHKMMRSREKVQSILVNFWLRRDSPLMSRFNKNIRYFFNVIEII